MQGLRFFDSGRLSLSTGVGELLEIRNGMTPLSVEHHCLEARVEGRGGAVHRRWRDSPVWAGWRGRFDQLQG